MSFLDTLDRFDERPARRRHCRLPFNGRLSPDEVRMLWQSVGTDGTDFEALLADLEAKDEEP